MLGKVAAREPKLKVIETSIGITLSTNTVLKFGFWQKT
jgi:hypothetical protein